MSSAILIALASLTVLPLVGSHGRRAAIYRWTPNVRPSAMILLLVPLPLQKEAGLECDSPVLTELVVEMLLDAAP